MSSIQALKRALNVRFEFTKYGPTFRYPYTIKVCIGPGLSQPIFWESFELPEAVEKLAQFRHDYPHSWIDKDSRIVVESGRWDLVQKL